MIESTRTEGAYLTVFAAAQLVARCHLQCQSRANLHLGGEQLGTIPVMLNLLLDLLANGQLLGLLLLL